MSGIDMTLYEFNALAEVERAQTLWEYGVHVAERNDNSFYYSLYQLNNFYVEVCYDNRNNKILKFTSFFTDTKLEPYLNKIDIDFL